jgi:hypothetical protein
MQIAPNSISTNRDRLKYVKSYIYELLDVVKDCSLD